MTEIATTISRKTIIDQAERTFKIQPHSIMDETTKKYLLEMGIDPTAARKRREEDEDEEMEEKRRRRA